METNKILGYVLIFAGLVMIALTLWQTFNVFTGAAKAPQVFRFYVFKQQPSSAVPGSVDAQKQIEIAVSKILPANSINDILNLCAFVAFAWILIFAGAQIANVGIKLLKEQKQ